MLYITRVIVLFMMSAVFLSGCDLEPTTELEIVDIVPEEPAPYSLGQVVRLLARVRNNKDVPATVALAASIRAVEDDAALIRRGVGREIRPDETVQLVLDLPVEDQYLKQCELKTVVFLAHTDRPPNINSIWVDSVEANNSQEVRYPVERPVLKNVNIVEPFRDVVVDSDSRHFQRYYQARMAYQPAESYWSVRNITVQTRNSSGERLEVLRANYLDGLLSTKSILWYGDEENRNSVTQASVRFEYRDCEGTKMELDKDGIRVQLSPQPDTVKN